MIGLIIAIIAVNFTVFKINKLLTKTQILNIWTFTMSFQTGFDIFVSVKYHGYWYFERDTIEWSDILPHLLLVPAVNIIFLNGYPFGKSLMKQLLYFAFWTIGILIYEIIALVPEPWGYFRYGWWNLWYSVILDPILLFILLSYYKLICKFDTQPISK